MPKHYNISYHLRHLLLSFTLLWALMLNGQEVVAYRAPAKATAPKAVQFNTTSDADTRTEVKQKVSLEATTSFVALNLQQAVIPVPNQTFAAPSDEALPALVASLPGAGFAAVLFPITIQPQAP
ncbi:RNA methyltransferase [Botryobacter ruber]|uniref:RNA methyltransferase n=1 Tax=Botryobacter ruber TaxID=2171629 RepID=UPI001F0C0723|nr:RNA methyltransferase [Botryobacter ruber]